MQLWKAYKKHVEMMIHKFKLGVSVPQQFSSAQCELYLRPVCILTHYYPIAVKCH